MFDGAQHLSNPLDAVPIQVVVGGRRQDNLHPHIHTCRRVASPLGEPYILCFFSRTAGATSFPDTDRHGQRHRHSHRQRHDTYTPTGTYTDRDTRTHTNTHRGTHSHTERQAHIDTQTPRSRRQHKQKTCYGEEQLHRISAKRWRHGAVRRWKRGRNAPHVESGEAGVQRKIWVDTHFSASCIHLLLDSQCRVCEFPPHTERLLRCFLSLSLCACTVLDLCLVCSPHPFRLSSS